MKITGNTLASFVILFLVSITRAQIPIAVVEFDGKNISQEEASVLTNRLRNELFRIGEFQVLERELMEQILSEQDFQLSGCTSNECLIEVGRLVGVRQMLGGSIGRVGNVFTVSARVVDVSTGQLLHVADYDYRGEIGELLTTGMREVAVKLSDLTGLAVSDPKTSILISNESSQREEAPIETQNAEAGEGELEKNGIGGAASIFLGWIAMILLVNYLF